MAWSDPGHQNMAWSDPGHTDTNPDTTEKASSSAASISDQAKCLIQKNNDAGSGRVSGLRGTVRPRTPPNRAKEIDSSENSGYTLARMKHEIIFAPEAVSDFKRLSARERSTVRDAIERHLRLGPKRTSRSRIKRLRGISRPQYRLRVGEIRVFYDVTEKTVEILAIIPKSGASDWLERMRGGKG